MLPAVAAADDAAQQGSSVKYTNLSIEQLTTPEQRKDAMEVRIAVFVDEQKYPLETEYDGLDEGSFHWAAYCDLVDQENHSQMVASHVPVGTVRLIPKPNGVAKLGRLAVLAAARGLYIGQTLVKEFIAYCKKHGYHTIVLHAQYPRRGFYEKLGFVIEEGEEIFDEDGTPHIRMYMRNIQA
ncbi:acyl-CoA N-acyltransferase [Mycotypha africana]|uniref:acyl-CoA N-acyltransferase n=1 Tax=Mycotypha africana TaxID=64632 RepID=UPI0023017F01|nr:acyl-CoA N-acyltransferase [Mycotypha africana]KAI8988186.1 acyl-CoA N-acyltransferase [Mycotypha africana]